MYKTYVFDCDGVVLDSNQVKTQAFYRAALPYGEAPAQALVDYHVNNGGISRYIKFSYFVEQLLPASQAKPDVDQLISVYANEVKAGLMTCRVAPGLAELRDQLADSRWLIVSGGDQQELREVFAARGLADWFDGGIFGSPDNKDVILQRELAAGNIARPAIFLGDSRYDHLAATQAGLDFVFLSQWTEFSTWQAYCQQHGLTIATDIPAFTNSLVNQSGA